MSAAPSGWHLVPRDLALVHPAGWSLDLRRVGDCRGVVKAVVELAALGADQDLADGVRALLAALRPAESMVGNPRRLTRLEVGALVVRSVVGTDTPRRRSPQFEMIEGVEPWTRSQSR